MTAAEENTGAMTSRGTVELFVTAKSVIDFNVVEPVFGSTYVAVITSPTFRTGEIGEYMAKVSLVVLLPPQVNTVGSPLTSQVNPANDG